MNYCKSKALEAYETAFGSSSGATVYFAPGRVNLIGEHTDYNGGHVLPAALTIGTYAAVTPRSDKICRFYSANFKSDGIVERSIDNPVYKVDKGFSNYPLGVIWALQEAGYNINHGFDMAIYGDIPSSSGLSSSASIEVLTCFICKELFGLDISGVDMALISQKAENKFIGVNCGIMDQFIIAMGKPSYATYLDTSTLEYEYIPVNLENSKIVIACSNKKRGLIDSKYNERREECEIAVAEIGNISALGELNEEQFLDVKNKISSDRIMRRARHAVLENQRTIKACQALRQNDLELFGKLMIESHISLRDDYEVTGIELDTLFNAALLQNGVVGSRMTGAGFGGCTISIVRDENIDDFIKNVGETYEKTIGYRADFYIVEIGGGPARI